MIQKLKINILSSLTIAELEMFFSKNTGEKQNRELFEDVYKRHFKDILFYINSFCRNLEFSENLAQDTFVSFWENIDKYDREKPAIAYLITIAKNKILNALKRAKIEQQYSDYAKNKALDVTTRTLKSSNLENIFTKDMEKIIGESVNGMNDKIRETFILSRYKYLNNADIAARQNISQKAVEYRITVALKILRKNLDDYLDKIKS